jgi:hypothetical protein
LLPIIWSASVTFERHFVGDIDDKKGVPEHHHRRFATHSFRAYSVIREDIMTDYDPRTATGIPTQPVGSLPRPTKLQQAYAAYDAGTIDLAALEAEQDAAVKDSIERFEATGSPIISDGEQRWSSFATYPITDTLTKEIKSRWT